MMHVTMPCVSWGQLQVLPAGVGPRYVPYNPNPRTHSWCSDASAGLTLENHDSCKLIVERAKATVLGGCECELHRVAALAKGISQAGYF